MSSTADTAESDASDPLDGYTVLGPPDPYSDKKLDVDLAEGLTLQIAGQPDSTTRPYVLTVRYDPAPEERRPEEHTLYSAAVSGPELGNDTARDRIVETIIGLYPDSADGVEDTLRETFDDLAAKHAAGTLFVLDDRAADMIDSTTDVEYRPEEGRPWKVSFGSSSATFNADTWASADPGASAGSRIPQTIGSTQPFYKKPERWQACREIWQRMAATG